MPKRLNKYYFFCGELLSVDGVDILLLLHSFKPAGNAVAV
jgi:hypothetical protein